MIIVVKVIKQEIVAYYTSYQEEIVIISNSSSCFFFVPYYVGGVSPVTTTSDAKRVMILKITAAKTKKVIPHDKLDGCAGWLALLFSLLFFTYLYSMIHPEGWRRYEERGKKERKKERLHSRVLSRRKRETAASILDLQWNKKEKRVERGRRYRLRSEQKEGGGKKKSQHLQQRG